MNKCSKMCDSNSIYIDFYIYNYVIISNRNKASEILFSSLCSCGSCCNIINRNSFLPKTFYCKRDSSKYVMFSNSLDALLRSVYFQKCAGIHTDRVKTNLRMSLNDSQIKVNVQTHVRTVGTRVCA